jgi:hypothetical protein
MIHTIFGPTILFFRQFSVIAFTPVATVQLIGGQHAVKFNNFMSIYSLFLFLNTLCVTFFISLSTETQSSCVVGTHPLPGK